MSTDATSLLRALSAGAAARGIGAAGTPVRSAGAAASAGQSFADLLSKAQSGVAVSGIPVTLGKDSGVSLTDEQLQRLSIAADRAEAAGVSRALVMIDGMALRLDVAVRQVTGPVELGPGLAAAGIDGVVHAPEARPTAGGGAGGPLPDTGALNASLLRTLARSGPATLDG